MDSRISARYCSLMKKITNFQHVLKIKIFMASFSDNQLQLSTQRYENSLITWKGLILFSIANIRNLIVVCTSKCSTLDSPLRNFQKMYVKIKVCMLILNFVPFVTTCRVRESENFFEQMIITFVIIEFFLQLILLLHILLYFENYSCTDY